MTEHYTRWDFSKQSDVIEFYNIKLKKSIVDADFNGAHSAIGHGADSHTKHYWFFWYVMEHFEESESYRDIAVLLKQSGAVTSGENPPKEPEFVHIYLADTL